MLVCRKIYALRIKYPFERLCGERHCESWVSCLTTWWPSQGEPGAPHPESSAVTIRSLCLPQLEKNDLNLGCCLFTCCKSYSNGTMSINLCFNKNISDRSLGGEWRMDRKIPQSNYWKTGNSYWRVSGLMYLVLPSNVLMLQQLIIQFPLYYLSSCRLQDVKNKRKFHTFSSKSGRVAHKRLQI